MHSRSFENSAFQMHRVNASCLGVLGVSLTFDKPLTSSTKPAFRNGKALLILSLIKPQPAESCKSTRPHYLSSHFSGSPSVMFTVNCLHLWMVWHIFLPRALVPQAFQWLPSSLDLNISSSYSSQHCEK